MTNFISDSSEVPVASTKTVYYNKNGEKIFDKYVLAHTVTKSSSKAREAYYALIVNGGLYDIESPRFPKEPNYRPISKSCFTKYLNYLESGSHHDYEKAAREYRKSQ